MLMNLLGVNEESEITILVNSTILINYDPLAGCDMIKNLLAHVSGGGLIFVYFSPSFNHTLNYTSLIPSFSLLPALALKILVESVRCAIVVIVVTG